jgi:peptide/nickel transport system substrate-binding protein
MSSGTQQRKVNIMDDRFDNRGTNRFLRRSMVALFGAAVLVATSLGSVATAQEPTSGGTLKAALTGEPDTLDPATSTIYTGAQVYDNIFSKLISVDENNEFYGVLATDWEQIDDTTWVFDLVEDATFHNGEPFTPADVVYTFERILDPATASGYAPLFDAIDSVEATGDHQVTFHLKTPFGPFLNNLANNGQIVNQVAIESMDPAREPVGTGPFEFVEWVQGDHVTLKKNEDYFRDGLPYLDEVIFRFLLVDQSRIEGLRSGELDWVDAVPLQQLPALREDPEFNYVTNPTAGIPDFLALNTTQPPFDDPALRQAVALAVDLPQIRDIAYFGAGEVGSQEVPSGSPWYSEGAGALDRDVEAAKAILEEAGIETPITIDYLGLPQYPELLKTGEVVREQLKEIGIEMNIEPVDVSIWFDRFINGDYQITSAYQERTIDPDNFYALVLRSGADINTTGYSNPELDALIDEARTETDEATRKELYDQIRAIVVEDAPIIFAHYETINYLMRDNVCGSTVNATLELRLENVAFCE